MNGHMPECVLCVQHCKASMWRSHEARNHRTTYSLHAKPAKQADENLAIHLMYGP
jgi:hypothetical protein